MPKWTSSLERPAVINSNGCIWLRSVRAYKAGSMFAGFVSSLCPGLITSPHPSPSRVYTLAWLNLVCSAVNVLRITEQGTVTFATFFTKLNDYDSIRNQRVVSKPPKIFILWVTPCDLTLAWLFMPFSERRVYYLLVPVTGLNYSPVRSGMFFQTDLWHILQNAWWVVPMVS